MNKVFVIIKLEQQLQLLTIEDIEIEESKVLKGQHDEWVVPVDVEVTQDNGRRGVESRSCLPKTLSSQEGVDGGW